MTRPMSIYVSGPITGREYDAEERFREACRMLGEASYAGIVNPYCSCPPGTPYREAMRRDLRLLLDCDGVALLDGWEESRGCRVEAAVARAIGIPARPIADWTVPWGSVGRFFDLRTDVEDALLGAGYGTVARVLEAPYLDLLAVKGVGRSTLMRIHMCRRMGLPWGKFSHLDAIAMDAKREMARWLRSGFPDGDHA